MTIKTTCVCGEVKENDDKLTALKETRFGCQKCGGKVTVEVIGATPPHLKRGK